MALPVDLVSTYKQRRLDQFEAGQKYARARENLVGGLKKANFLQADIDAFLDEYEKQMTPEYASASPDQKAYQWARRVFDAAVQRGVEPVLVDDFITRLKSFRKKSHDALGFQEHMYAQGGEGVLSKIDGEISTLGHLQNDLMETALRINPNVSVDTVFSMTGDNKEHPTFDPLRASITVAMDRSAFNPEDALHRDLWHSLEGLLNQKERTVLMEDFFERLSPSGNLSHLVDGKGFDFADPKLDRSAVLAAAFSSYVSGENDGMGIIRTESFAERAFSPVSRFFGRLENKISGNGFQITEDVFKKAAQGRIAERQKDKLGLRCPDGSVDRAGSDRFKAGLKKMTDAELMEALRKQKNALTQLQKRERGFFKTARRILKPSSKNIAKSRDGFGLEELRANKSLSKDMAERREFNEARRARALMLKEFNGRREKGFSNAAEAVGLGPVPQRPTIMGGNNIFDQVAMASQLKTGLSAVMPGNDRTFTVSQNAAGGPMPYTVGMKTPGNPDAAMAYTGTQSGAHTYAMAMNTASGVTPAAAALAAEMNQAGMTDNADILLLRHSGMINEDLDKEIEAKNLYAFAYPTKDGGVIINENGQWRAVTMPELAQAARGDLGLRDAYEVLSHAAPMVHGVRTRTGVEDGQGPERTPPGAAPVQEKTAASFKTAESSNVSLDMDSGRYAPSHAAEGPDVSSARPEGRYAPSHAAESSNVSAAETSESEASAQDHSKRVEKEFEALGLQNLTHDKIETMTTEEIVQLQGRIEKFREATAKRPEELLGKSPMDQKDYFAQRKALTDSLARTDKALEKRGHKPMAEKSISSGQTAQQSKGRGL